MELCHEHEACCLNILTRHFENFSTITFSTHFNQTVPRVFITLRDQHTLQLKVEITAAPLHL